MAYALIDGCHGPDCIAERSVLLNAHAPPDPDTEWTAKGARAICVACGAHHLVTTNAPVLTLGRSDIELALVTPQRAVELVGELHGKRASIWACSVCRGAHQNPDGAERCCNPNLCRECGKPANPYWLVCSSCTDAAYRRKQMARTCAAAKVAVADYAHKYVFLDGGGDFVTVDDWLDDEPDERTYPAWACCDLPPPRIDAMHWLEGALDEYHDDVLDELDVDGLQKLLDGWTAEQSVSSFVVDYDRVVVLTASSCWACGADGDPLNEDGRCPACAAPEQGA